MPPLHQHLNTTQIRRECKGGRYVGGSSKVLNLSSKQAQTCLRDVKTRRPFPGSSHRRCTRKKIFRHDVIGFEIPVIRAHIQTPENHCVTFTFFLSNFSIGEDCFEKVSSSHFYTVSVERTRMCSIESEAVGDSEIINFQRSSM